MQITFPHMGNIGLPLKKMLETAGAEVVLPPQNSKRTLTLGTKHSPEFVCLPFKMTLGNFIEALELGADTILMAAGPGRCRFGFYGEVQQRILHDLGYRFQMLQINIADNALINLIRGLRSVMPGLSWRKAFQAIRMGMAVLQAVDTLEKELSKIRPRESQKGAATQVFQLIMTRLHQAGAVSEVQAAAEYGLRLMREVPVAEKISVLKIGLLGEIYVVLEPYVNADVERRLGDMGVEVTKFLYPGDWALFNLFIKALKILPEHNSVTVAAKPYLNYFVGGDGLKTVGQSVLCAQGGYNGIIQLYPFTCMPEIVAQYMLPRIQEDFNMPVLMLGVDEHTGVTGMQTRLEAFVDLVRRKQGAGRPTP